MTKFTILGCGSSLGSPWITNNWGKLNKKNKFNIRTRCSAHIKKGDLSLDDKFIISENAWRLSQSGYSSMFIMVNDEVTVENLLKGIIIVSGNDAAMPILGYSFVNQFRQDSMPVQLESLFNEYQNDIRELYNNNSNPTSAIRLEWDKYSAPFTHQPTRSVQPLLSRNWDQGTPWNDMCPEDSNGPGGNVLVGCVAVSMAQVMHYWQHPSYGYGENSYLSNYGVLEADFGNTFYDFENISLEKNFLENNSEALLADLNENQEELVIQSDKQSEINDVIYAEGNVYVSYRGKILKADTLIYDKLNKKISAN